MCKKPTRLRTLIKSELQSSKTNENVYFSPCMRNSLTQAQVYGRSFTKS